MTKKSNSRPCSKRLADGHATVAFAHGLVADMRMRNVFVRRSGMGIERNDAIVAGMAVDQIAPVESDLELAKVNAFQFDWLGRDRQGC